MSPDPIECNSPFDNVPVCACDTGKTSPTKMQQLECRARGGQCSERHHDANRPQSD